MAIDSEMRKPYFILLTYPIFSSMYCPLLVVVYMHGKFPLYSNALPFELTAYTGFFFKQTKWQNHYKLIHISEGTGVRTPVMTSGLTISAFCPVISHF